MAPSIEHINMPFSDDIKTVLDIGANRGQFALFALERFREARVHCFEPLPSAAAAVEAVVPHTDRNRVILHVVALGDVPGVRALHVTRENDSSSLLPIGALQRRSFPGSEETGTVDVKVARLDQVIGAADLQRPCLAKIDVQGFELNVLSGAGVLLPLIDEILVEVSFAEFYEGQSLADEVTSYLFAKHYVLVALRPSANDRLGRVLQADALFRRTPDGSPRRTTERALRR